MDDVYNFMLADHLGFTKAEEILCQPIHWQFWSAMEFKKGSSRSYDYCGPDEDRCLDPDQSRLINRLIL